MTGFNCLEEDVTSAQSDNKFVKLTINLFLLNFFFFLPTRLEFTVYVINWINFLFHLIKGDRVSPFFDKL